MELPPCVGSTRMEGFVRIIDHTQLRSGKAEGATQKGSYRHPGP